jgi:hypothetical protein
VQWDKVENKSSVIVYTVGGFVAVWLSSTIVSALNNVPLVSNHPIKTYLPALLHAFPTAPGRWN